MSIRNSGKKVIYSDDDDDGYREPRIKLKHDDNQLKAFILEAQGMVLELIEEENFSPEQLDDIAKLVKQMADKKRGLSPIEKVRSEIKNVKNKYYKISPSGNWKKCERELKELNEIAFGDVIESALKLAEVDDRWTIAFELTSCFSTILFDVEEWGGKLVNGSMGDWCPEFAGEIEDFWRLLVESPQRPSPSVVQNIDIKQLVECLGDYSDLAFIQKHIEELKLKKEAKDNCKDV